MNIQQIKLIILDRDGVLNFDSDDYIKSPEEWLPIPSSAKAVKQLNDAGYTVAVATNQSGVGRGYYSQTILDKIHAKMQDELSSAGAHVDALVFCPHTPNDNCTCRKPKPGMLKTLLEKFSTTPEETLMVGDALRDLQAAWALGCAAVLLKTGKGAKTLLDHPEKLKDTPVFEDLEAFASAFLGGTLSVFSEPGD